MPDSIEQLEEGRRYEGHGVLDRALECYTSAADCAADPAVISQALTHQSRVYRCRSEWSEALDAAHRAQEAARSAGLASLLVEATIAEGNVFMCRGEFTEALALFRGILEASTDPRVRGIALQNIGSILWQQGQLGAAERALSESFGWFQRADYQLGAAIALNNHGRITLERGNAELAKHLLTQALEAARANEDAELIALVTLNYAEALAALGDRIAAEEQASTALGYFAASGNRWREIECLRLIGTINEQLINYEDAHRCFSRALTIAREIGAKHDERLLQERMARLLSHSGSAPSSRQQQSQ